MKNTLTWMVVGLMAILLTGCGQQAPKQPDVKIQPMAAPVPAEKSMPAAPAVEPAAEPAAKQP